MTPKAVNPVTITRDALAPADAALPVSQTIPHAGEAL
jgi:hypothetical protein